MRLSFGGSRINYVIGNRIETIDGYDVRMGMTTYGDLLKQWRTTRGVSQLDLATRAGVSQRHVSFLETGRSRPSPEMVTHLGITLDAPPRERNRMLLAAGYAPGHSETPLEELDDVTKVLGVILESHMPNPAFVIDRRWNLALANQAATVLTGLLFPTPPSWIEPPLNVMRLSFHPDGMRPHMEDWEKTASFLLRRLERDAASHPGDEGLQDLLAEMLDYPDVAELREVTMLPSADELLVTATYNLAGKTVSFFTTISVIGDAHDLTLAELRLETFWPADAESNERWTALTSGLL